MKCEGAEAPPCVRCRKAGRDCMVQTQHLLHNKPYAHLASSTLHASYAYLPSLVDGGQKALPPSPGTMLNNGESMYRSDSEATSATYPQPEEQVRPPTIYSTSPVDTVMVTDHNKTRCVDAQVLDNPSPRKRGRLDIADEIPPSTATHRKENVIISRVDMRDMVNL